MKIGNRAIGPSFPCYIIAELSCNHNQRFEEAVELIKAAAKAGADAVKLQTYTPDTMTINSDKQWFRVDSPNAPESWKSTLYELYENAYTPWEWHEPLQKVALEYGVDFFSTPFDESAVEFLETLNVPCHKIASYEATYTQLLRAVGATQKPVILSVGFASLEEIENAVSTLRESGTKDLALLHCVTTYQSSPTAPEMRLSTIKFLQERFNAVTGFSDNNGGYEFPAMSVLAGGCIVEKHLNLSAESLDAKFSLDPDQFAEMVRNIRKAESTLGVPTLGTTNDVEAQFRRYRRSIFVSRDIKAGEKFSDENLRVIRPADGLEPRFLDQILGLHASQDIDAGTPLSWNLVQSPMTVSTK